MYFLSLSFSDGAIFYLPQQAFILTISSPTPSIRASISSPTFKKGTLLALALPEDNVTRFQGDMFTNNFQDLVTLVKDFGCGSIHHLPAIDMESHLEVVRVGHELGWDDGRTGGFHAILELSAGEIEAYHIARDRSRRFLPRGMPKSRAHHHDQSPVPSQIPECFAVSQPSRRGPLRRWLWEP